MQGRILRRIALIAGSATILVAIVAWQLMIPTHQISQAGYEKIKLGMKMQEVEDILGGPPGDYGFGNGEILNSVISTMASSTIATDPRKAQWLATDFGITVTFDEHGRAHGMCTERVYRQYTSIWELVMQKLHLRPEAPCPDGYYRVSERSS